MKGNWGTYGKQYQSISAIPSYFADIVAQRLFNRPITEPVLFLDVAAGPGTLTRSIFHYFDSENIKLQERSEFHVTDYAEGMVQTAKSALSELDVVKYGISRVNYYQMDGCDPVLQNAGGGKVTHLGCMFGIMFFPQRLTGLQRLRELMVPKGKAIFGTWFHSDPIEFCHDFARALAAATSGEETVSLQTVIDDLPCKDPKEVEQELLSVGYHSVQSEQVEHIFHLEVNEGLFSGFVLNPVFMDQFDIFRQLSKEELLVRWNEFLTPDHPFGQRWLLPEDSKRIALRFVANLIEAFA